MAKQKKPVHRVQMTEGKRNIIHQFLEEYDIQTTAVYVMTKGYAKTGRHIQTYQDMPARSQQ